MDAAHCDEVSLKVLDCMREGGFDFSRVHPIEFYAVFPDEGIARQAARQFQGEWLNAQVQSREDGCWDLQVSKVMFAMHQEIVTFERCLQQLLEPMGGVLDGWGVTQEPLPHARSR